MQYFIYYILDMIKFYFIYRYGLGMQVRQKKFLLPGAGLFVGGMTLFLENLAEEKNPIFVYLLLAFLFLHMGFYIEAKKIFVVGFWAICFVGFMDQTSEIFVAEITGKSFFQWKPYTVLDDIASFVTIVFIGGVIGIVNHKSLYALRKITMPYYLLFMFMCLANELFLAVVKKGILQDCGHSKFIFAFYSFSTVLQLFILLLVAISNQIHKEQEIVNRKYLQEQESYYLYLEEKEKNTRKFRHDIRHHLYMLKQLAMEENQKEVKHYIEKIAGVLEDGEQVIDVGNKIVNAILNRYFAMCQKKGIQFKVEGYLPAQMEIDAFDLCTVFSNLLQNAVEAAEKTEEKKIALKLQYDEEWIYVKEKNTFLNEISKKKGILETTKKNKEDHGYGLMNMKKSIKKYFGDMVYSRENEMFQIRMQMSYKKKAVDVKFRPFMSKNLYS